MSNSTITTTTVNNPPITYLDAELLAGAGPSGQDIYRERVQITGAALAEVARVENTSPATTDYGVVTRNLPRPATSGTPVGVTVSNSAVIIVAANANRKSIVISNSGARNVYLGVTNAVTASGATLGIQIAPNGTYQDSGDGIYTGDIYGIANGTVGSPNISVWERT